jgi:hypothetical protein
MSKVFKAVDDRIRPDLCFVIMPFSVEFANVYAAIKAVVEDAGLRCVRADALSRTSRITDDVYEHIRAARVIVADISGQNPNVFYELGLAHALEKSVVTLVQHGQYVPFDVQGIRYCGYSVGDFDVLQRALAQYLAGCLQTLPEQWTTEQTVGKPNVRISHLDWSRTVAVDQTIPIRVVARNFGDMASEGYFSISFPGDGAQIRSVASDVSTRIGRRPEHWKGERVILQYPIAEARVQSSEPPWRPEIAHFMEVEAVPNRRGLIQFYVSASSRYAKGSYYFDPEQSLLTDQRDEPVYCGVIRVD